MSTPTLITLPNATLAPIYTFLRSAKSSIDITMYELADTTAQQILADKVAAGVTVRVILDQNRERASNTAAFTFLQQARVQVVWANPTYAATHQKTITIDRATSAIMTLNLTSQYYSTSRDFALLTTDPTTIRSIETTFEADFASASITPPTATHLVWSPTNATSSLVHLIHSAKHTLAVENEEMADPAITSALVAAAKRGVVVHITMSANPAYNAAFETLSAAGVYIRTYAQTDPLYIHAKILLADAGQPTARAFLGSENFSVYSLTLNRELGILLTDAAILSSLAATMSSDFAGAAPWNATSAKDQPAAIRQPS